jgi:hypothetical protein
MGLNTQDLYLINTQSDLHLRDARHAMQLYTEHGHALGPKTKFLYHVVFEYSAPLDKIINSSTYRKELGVLVKSVDLPKFRAAVETVNQYNRKKRVQTRVDYEEINIKLHDDNTGLTRSMLEEYYKYYTKDPHKNSRGSPLDFGARDKYTSQVPRYGLDNGTNGPYFSYIRIYQLSRKKWFSYTLVNPILTAWGHDDMQYSDGNNTMENSMTVAYESVLYNTGDLRRGDEPKGFTDVETRYDQVHSPLRDLTPFSGVETAGVGRQIEPVVIPQFDKYDNTGLNTIGSIFRNISSGRKDPRGILSSILNTSREGRQLNRLGQIIFPTARGGTQRTQDGTGRPVSISQTRTLSGDSIRSGLSTNRRALDATVTKTLATGAYGPDWNSRNFGNFKNLPREQQTAIETDIINRAASGDRKIGQIASEAIAANKG